MKVYIVSQHVDYEGSSNVSVHGSESSAESEADILNKENEHGCVSYHVEEWSVSE